MGYYSNYTLLFKKKDKSEFSDKEIDVITNEIKETCMEIPDGVTNMGASMDMYFSDTKWYDWQDELLKVMKNHPDISLAVTREGEEHDDTEKLHLEAGTQHWQDFSDIVIERPNPGEGNVFVAVLDSKDASVSLVAVPQDKDPEEWLEKNFENFDSNCTWQTVRTLNFCNQKEISL